jgi:peptidyl-prolyl cis-trans isomerase C
MRFYVRQLEGKHVKRTIEQHALLFGFYVAVLFVVCSLACKPKTPARTDVNAPRPTTAAETVADGVAVTVNGVDITESQIQALIAPELQKLSAKTAQLPPAFAEQYQKQLRQQALENLIVEQLLDVQVKQAKIEVTEEEVTAQIGKIASGQSPPLSLDDFKKKIEEYGRSYDELKQQIHNGLGYQKLMEAQWADKINVTQEDAKKYYSENKKEFETPEQVRTSHILIQPKTGEPNVDPNQAKDQAKAKAQGLLEQIKGGADFAELAKANSDCPSRAKGGDLDFFGRGDMVEPFEEAAFKLQPGQVSDVVETKFGYHIIKVTEHKDASVTAFEQVQGDIMNRLTQNKRAELAQKFIESLKEKASIVYPPGKEPKVAEPVLPSGSQDKVE